MQRSSNIRSAYLAACLAFFYINLSLSQSITYQNPDEFFVCGVAPFEFTVQNTSGATLNNVTVNVHFATNSGAECGMIYTAGTVSGAGESNLSNLSSPVFSLGNMSAGATQVFTIQAEAPCSLVDCIDNAEVFVNQITLNWNGGSTSLTTSPFIVERALLVITSLNSTVMTGSKGDILQRKITIRNTRPGALQGFLFTDIHQPGISISSNQGTDISNGNTFQIALGGNDFTSTGDGDGLFEFNEAIIITENILIEDCGVDITSCVSNITAGWGCGGDMCQQVSTNAIVTIKPTDKTPNLVLEPILSVPECFCGPDGHRQGMKITNTGIGTAHDVVLYVAQPEYWLAGFVDTTSVEVDSAGTPIDFKAGYSGPVFFPSVCDIPAASNNFFVRLTSLEPGETVSVYWDLYFCSPGCKQPEVGWRYRYSYFKDCPPNPFFEITDYIEVGKSGLKMSTATQTEVTDLFMDDSTYTVYYELKYDSLNILDDTLVLQIELPCGLIWDPDNELILNNQHTPLELTYSPGDTFSFVTATYLLPFDSDTATTQYDLMFDCESLCLAQQVCKDSIQTSCMAIDSCGGYIPPFISGIVKSSILKCEGFPPECNIEACSGFGGFYECPIDSVCLKVPPGYVSYAFDAARKNYGLPDNNNDQLADGAGSLNMNLVARQRFIAGDTLHATLNGSVVIDQPGASLAYGSVEFSFTVNPITLSQDNSEELLKESGIAPAGARLRIFDKSQNTWYECTSLVPQATVLGLQLLYHFDISTATLQGCGVPAGFGYEQGDSILFEGDFRINYNILRDMDPDPLLGLVNISPSFRIHDGNTDQYEPLNCACTSEFLEVLGYEYAIVPGVFALPPCANSQYIGGSLVRLVLEKGNMFPYEYRNLMKVLDWQMEIPATVELLETRMTFLRLQDGANVTSNQIITPAFTNGAYTFDLTQFQNPPLEEGFSALFQYILKSDCDNTGSMPVTLTSNLDFTSGLPEDEDPLALTIEANALRALIANLKIEAPLFNLVSFNNQLVLDFDLINVPTVVGPSNSGPAPNTWLYVSSSTGSVTNFQLINQTTGLPVPSVNGVFQLGAFPADTLGFPFQLRALNNSCQQENLEIHYGWNCTPFTSTVQTPCYEQVQPLTILSPPGEIDMFVTSPSGCSDLCDTIPYHTIEIFNAQLGAVYDLTLTGLLPPGMSVLGGSSQVEYPAGSGNVFPIGDPEVPNGSIVQWNLSELVDAIAAGLPGVSAAPDNGLVLSFLGETTCDFVANSYSLFIVTAEQNCGTPTNTVAKPGDPLCINGVSQPYSTNINVEAVPGFNCNDAVTFEVSVTATETLPLGACAIITLPQGITYQQGSCSSACQANFNCNPTVAGNTLTWQLPPGVDPNQIVCFKFTSTGWSELGCTEGVLLFRSANETQALCALTGDSCSTKVGTGALIFPYQIQKPALELSNFMLNATQAGTDDLAVFSIDITNNSQVNATDVTMEFYLDTDGDGDGDQLVNVVSLNDDIGPGDTYNFPGQFILPGGNLCNLVAFIDPGTQCACSGDSAYVTFPIVYETSQNWTVCSGEDLLIGVPAQPGFNYQWSPNDCLGDPNTATTTFNCLNDTPSPALYNFTLEAGKGNCKIENLIDVTLQPVPGILFAETPICSGETANLVATDGVSFDWQGPGVIPGLQVQSVTPAVTSTYTVEVVDSVGCGGTESVTVVVNPVPMIYAGPDTTYCPGSFAQLNAAFNAGYDYLWSPATVGGTPALNNPAIHNPVVLTTENTTFAVSVTDDNGCKNSDSVTLSFGDSLELTISPDITICAGTSTVLVAGGATSYEWSPSGQCVNTDCSSILVMPAVTTTYTVTATDTAGCTAQASVTVTVTTDIILTTGDPVEICEGETAVIFGENISEPGIYCDTTMLASGCDSVHCIELIVKPLIDSTLFADTICLGETVDFQGETLTETGLYCETFSATNGCDSIVCLDLLVLDTPQVQLLVPDTAAIGNMLELSISPSDFDSILWFGGSITGECTNSPVCTDSLAEGGELDYSVTVMDANGCVSTASKLVTVTFQCDPADAELPNVFSPNNDNLNDFFTIVSPGREVVLSMKIWNRWGEKVYDGAGPWDGMQDGKPAGSDVYIYIIRVGCPAGVDAEEQELKGDVTLLR